MGTYQLSTVLKMDTVLEQKSLISNKKGLNKPLYLALLFLFSALNSIDLYALPTPLNCESKFYQNIQKTLKTLDMNTGLYTSIGNSANKYNAIDWDRRTNLIYGIDAINRELLVIDNTGIGTSLGVPVPVIGGTIFPTPIAAGMDENGNLWTHGLSHVNKTDYKSYKINVDTNTFEEVAFTFTNFTKIEASIADLVYIKSTHSLWGVNKNNFLYQFDLNNLTVTQTPVTGLPHEILGYGAGFTFIDDSLFFASNTQGHVYKVSDYTSAAATATFFVTSEITNSNDGASCPLASVPVPPGNGPSLPPLNYGEHGRFNFREIN